MLKRTLAGLKRRGTLAHWLAARGDSLVRIVSMEGGLYYWRPDGCGYTCDELRAGIYTLRDAIKRSGHCGPEKRIEYWFAENGAEVTQ